MERIRVRTRSAQCLEDVTEQVAEAVRRSGVEEGVCHLFVPHTTAGYSRFAHSECRQAGETG